MREIVIQQNVFLNETKIVPVFGIMEPDKQQVIHILSNLLYFIGIEPTRKTKLEGKCLLVTTKSKLYCAQREADNLLVKYYKRN